MPWFVGNGVERRSGPRSWVVGREPFETEDAAREACWTTKQQLDWLVLDDAVDVRRRVAFVEAHDGQEALALFVAGSGVWFDASWKAGESGLLPAP